MPKGPADGEKRNTGIAAGGVSDTNSRLNGAPSHNLDWGVIDHTILDTAGHVEILGLGVKGELSTLEFQFNRQQRRVTDQAVKATDAPEGIVGHGASSSESVLKIPSFS